VLHALEADTGKSFLFEGSEGLALDHFAITFMGTREEVEERALPFRPGDEVLVEIVEPHMYDVDDAVAKIDGYIISIAGAAGSVGQKRMVRIDQVGRTAATALLLDEAGEVITVAPRPERRREPAPRRAAGESTSRRGSGEAAKNGAGSGTRQRLLANPYKDDEPGSRAGEQDAEEIRAAQLPAEEGEQPPADGAEDGVQSKPRRRGRRGGRRRSAAKAKAPE
jgi:predicted RNA-binding protein with TRAM domain